MSFTGRSLEGAGFESLLRLALYGVVNPGSLSLEDGATGTWTEAMAASLNNWWVFSRFNWRKCLKIRNMKRSGSKKNGVEQSGLSMILTQ